MNKMEKYRKIFHLSPNYVAKYLNLSIDDYILIEKGIILPSFSQVKKLEILYGLKFEDIIQKITQESLQKYDNRE